MTGVAIIVAMVIDGGISKKNRPHEGKNSGEEPGPIKKGPAPVAQALQRDFRIWPH